MPRVRRRGHKTRAANLTWLQRIGLQFGVGSNLGFRSEREARSGWDSVRDIWMAQCGRGPHLFKRPGAWWQFEAPADREIGENSREFLRRHGLLTPEERVCLG